MLQAKHINNTDPKKMKLLIFSFYGFFRHNINCRFFSDAEAKDLNVSSEYSPEN
jgi:hypothetical protein